MSFGSFQFLPGPQTRMHTLLMFSHSHSLGQSSRAHHRVAAQLTDAKEWLEFHEALRSCLSVLARPRQVEAIY